MIHPLIHNDQWALYLMQMGNGIFRQHCNAVGIDQFRYTMIDLRVNMVWTAG